MQTSTTQGDTYYPPSVLIVDDHPLVRSFLSRLLETAGITVCGAAGNTSDALRLLEKHRPSVAVIDISLDASNGLDLIRKLREHGCRAKPLVLSSHDTGVYARRARDAGAMGYLNKKADSDTILDAIRTLLLGGEYWPDVQKAPSGASSSAIASLSKREMQVFELIGSGLGTTEIAERLGLSIKTIETHRANIRKKLELPSGNAVVREAVQWVYENG